MVVTEDRNSIIIVLEDTNSYARWDDKHKSKGRRRYLFVFHHWAWEVDTFYGSQASSYCTQECNSQSYSCRWQTKCFQDFIDKPEKMCKYFWCYKCSSSRNETMSEFGCECLARKRRSFQQSNDLERQSWPNGNPHDVIVPHTLIKSDLHKYKNYEWTNFRSLSAYISIFDYRHEEITANFWLVRVNIVHRGRPSSNGRRNSRCWQASTENLSRGPPLVNDTFIGNQTTTLRLSMWPWSSP